MSRPRAPRSSLAIAAGLLYTILGAVLVADQVGLVTVDGSIVWPLIFLAVGSALLLGGGGSAGGTDAPPVEPTDPSGSGTDAPERP